VALCLRRDMLEGRRFFDCLRSFVDTSLQYCRNRIFTVHFSHLAGFV
jgi:hypothetical protein